MRRLLALLPALVLAACGGDGLADDLVASLETHVDAVRVEVDHHAAAVEGAASADEVTALQTDHRARMEAHRGQMGMDLERMDGCSHHGGASAGPGDVEARMDRMRDLLDAHAAAHLRHADPAECRVATAAYREAMLREVTGMRASCDAMRGGMSCDGMMHGGR